MNSAFSIYQRAHRVLKKNGFAGLLSVGTQLIKFFFSGICLKKPKKGALNILYVIGSSSNESARYRVYNLIEALAPHGITAQATHQESLIYLRPNGYDAVVFFRCKMNATTKRFAEKCRRLAIPKIYDVDDLVFDEAIIDRLHKEGFLTDKQYQVYMNETSKYTLMLKACDYATGATVYLCDYMRALVGIDVFHIPNGLNQAQIKAAEKLPQKPSAGIKIGFLSGSNTHKRDFELAVPSLLSMMVKYPDVSLVIVGYLDIPTEFEYLGDRVVHVPYMDYIELIQYCSQIYAVIIPLEYETAFCNAKSELKYFEQALVGVPVIASPTATYKACITDGVNGLLAANAEQWEMALEQIISDRDFHDTLAKNALQQIRGSYYPEKIGEAASETYRQITESWIMQMERRKN